jgi:hypothetical protein
MTSIISEIEAIEHLDFTPEETCESDAGCDNTATWLLVTPCTTCDNYALCDKCHNIVAEFLNKGPVMVCPAKHGSFQASEFRWERL